MKRILKFLAILLLSIIALIVLVFGVLSVKYSPMYVYRLVRYNVADVYDYMHLENRVSRNARND